MLRPKHSLRFKKLRTFSRLQILDAKTKAFTKILEFSIQGLNTLISMNLSSSLRMLLQTVECRSTILHRKSLFESSINAGKVLMLIQQPLKSMLLFRMNRN